MESASGVIFMVTPIEGQYRIHIKGIPFDEECKSFVPVYSKCIKKYNKLIHCNEWYDRFEAMNDEDKQTYVAKYLRGEGIQKVKIRKEGEFVLKRVVTKQLFIRRGKGNWRLFTSYSNPHTLKRAMKRFQKNGYEVFTETGQARDYKIHKDEMHEAREYLIFEDKTESYGKMSLHVAKKVKTAIFWQKK
jgi:hypothetical protein